MKPNNTFTDKNIKPVNLLKEMTVDELIKSRSSKLPLIRKEDAKSFDFEGRVDEDHRDIKLKSSGNSYSVGSIELGHAELMSDLGHMARTIHTNRSLMRNNMKDGLVGEKTVNIIEAFGWIVRSFKWFNKKGLKLHSFEKISYIDGYIHPAASAEFNTKLVLADKKRDQFITIYKMFGKRGLLVTVKPISSLIDKNGDEEKAFVVDSIIKMKKVINDALNDTSDDMFFDV